MATHSDDTTRRDVPPPDEGAADRLPTASGPPETPTTRPQAGDPYRSSDLLGAPGAEQVAGLTDPAWPPDPAPGALDMPPET